MNPCRTLRQFSRHTKWKQKYYKRLLKAFFRRYILRKISRFFMVKSPLAHFIAFYVLTYLFFPFRKRNSFCVYDWSQHASTRWQYHHLLQHYFCPGLLDWAEKDFMVKKWCCTAKFEKPEPRQPCRHTGATSYKKCRGQRWRKLQLWAWASASQY